MSKPTDIPPLRCRHSGNPCGTDTWMAGDPCRCESCQYYLEHERFRSALQVAELRAAAALAECAPTTADRYDWSAKDHSELVALVRGLRQRAEAAERERDAALKRAETAESTADGLRLLQATTDEVATGLVRERDEARDEVTGLTGTLNETRKALKASGTLDWIDSVRKDCGLVANVETIGEQAQRLSRERDAARAELDLLRKKLPLHPSGCCTCAGEGRCAWCQIAGLREALEFYAEERNYRKVSAGEVIGHMYLMTDHGERAREALKP
jgi:hypothetical protein